MMLNIKNRFSDRMRTGIILPEVSETAFNRILRKSIRRDEN